MPGAPQLTNFKLCVWMLPPASHPWHTVTRQFEAHVTLRSHLSSEEEVERLLQDHEGCHVEVILVGDVYSNGDKQGFYSIECAVRPVGQQVPWWPEGAHVSFRYRYGKPFTREEVQHVRQLVCQHSHAHLTRVEARSCSGHFSTWAPLMAQKKGDS